MNTELEVRKKNKLVLRENLVGASVGGAVSALTTTLLTFLASLGWIEALLISLPAAALFFIAGRSLARKNEERLPTTPGRVVGMEEFGISEYVTSLVGSRFDPLGCIEQIERNLCFMGVFGSKWVSEAHIRARVESFLEAVERRQGRVRFLLLDPEGEGCAQLRKVRKGALSEEPLRYWYELCEKWQILEVRLYSTYPCFRLAFIDHRLLTVSYHKEERGVYDETRQGWNAPQIVVEPGSVWSLYSPFERLYEEVWKTSRPISDYYSSTEAPSE